MSRGDEWVGFVEAADDFFISYAVACPYLLRTHSFLVGHAIELYLKAVRIMQINSVEDACKDGHDVKTLFESCQEADPRFMHWFKLQGTFEDLASLDDQAQIRELNADESIKLNHFRRYCEFYLIAENLQNLKYLGAPWRHRNPYWRVPPDSWSSCVPDDFWIKFVKEIRTYLGYAGSGQLDLIKRCLEDDSVRVEDLPHESRIYLSKIYE
jgi:hypothetical protein